MFNVERWQEIFETIRKNKLRTFLTGLSVASGIFILVILLAIGQGMQNGVAKEFENDAANRISVWTGVTCESYKGLNPVEGVRGDYQFLENASMVTGRFINNNDLNNYEKVVVIGNRVYQDLFKQKNAIGEYIKITGIQFKVIGVYTDPGGEREETRVFIPLTTSQRIYNAGNDLRSLVFTLKPEDNFDQALAASEAFSAELENDLKTRYSISPTDERAVNINNSLENAKRFFDLMNMIRWFFWGVGICTIIAGVVGVSNIMLIIVKERTKEIGIRKAIGAQPLSIIGMILHESVFVTAIAGFVGLIFSLLLLEFVGPLIETDYIRNPSVDFGVAITTVFILIIAGTLAGFFPARRAAKIKPIVALRDE